MSSSLNSLILVKDMTEVNALPLSVVSLLKVKNLIPKNDHNVVSFCGILIDKKSTYIFLPMEVDIKRISYDDSYKYSALLMRTIEMYARESLNSVYSEEPSQNLESVSGLGVVRKILENYLQNGLYQQKVKQVNRNSGRTCWRTTIANSFPVLNKLKQPIYTELYGKKVKYNSQNVVAKIQATIVSNLDERFSWLITGKKGLIAPELGDVEKLSQSVDWQIATLKREKYNTYSQADLTLISSLINYLEECYFGFESTYACGLTKFHTTWEHMLRQVTPNTFDLNSILPAPVYRKESSERVPNNRKRMETDIAIHHPTKDKIIIVDAKYYAVSKGNLPGWHDLVKQFFYIKAARLVYSADYCFSNVFIFPGSEGEIKTAVVTKINSEIPLTEEFPTIHCFYICPLIVMESYVTGTMLHSLHKSLLEAPIK
jgi:hypothetical protein